MSIEDAIREALPGATVRRDRYGYAVGGFSMPPVEARAVLSRAGLGVKDVFGQTVVTGFNAVQTVVDVRDGQTRVVDGPQDPGPRPSHEQPQLFAPVDVMRGQTSLGLFG